MKRLMRYLHTDEELQQMRKEWKERFKEPFPGFNFDEYGNVELYKEKIREGLDSGDPKKAHIKITKWDGFLEFSEMLKKRQIRRLKTAEFKELLQMMNEWKERFEEPAPKFNIYRYRDMVQYKEKIQEALESGDPKKAYVDITTK